MTDQHQVEILLVEDDSADAELTLRAFKARNFANQVFVARDGAEALDFFFGDGSHPLRDIGVVPKVVLLDLKLPKVDGLEVLRRLRADDRTRRIRSSSSLLRVKNPISRPRTGWARTVTSSSRWTSRRSRAPCRR